MRMTEEDLKQIRHMCLEYYSDEEPNIRSIILYGSAAKNFVGHDNNPGDIDLNIFLTDQTTLNSTSGMPKIIGEYNGLKVEAMRNKVPSDTTIERYIEMQDSKRWPRIVSEPVVQIYPDVQRDNWE